MILMGWPMSAMMNRMHMMTAEIARNSPRITILPNVLVIVQVVRNDQHHGRGRNTDQERELADVQAPRYIPVKAGESQTRR